MVVYSGGNGIHCYELFIYFLYCIGSHCLWSRLDRLHTDLLDFVLSSLHPVGRAIICSLGIDWPLGCYYQICDIFLLSQSFWGKSSHSTLAILSTKNFKQKILMCIKSS